MGVFRDLLGSLESAFSIGSSALSGLRRLRFRNDAGTIDLDATPTGTHTITMPARTGTALVRDSSGNVGTDLTLTGLTVESTGSGSFSVAPGGGNIGLELRNTAGGLTYADLTSHPTRDFDLRLLVNTDGTEARFVGRTELSLFHDLPTIFTSTAQFNNGLTLLNSGGSRSITLQGGAATQENIDFVADGTLRWRILRAPTSYALILQRYIAGTYQENLLTLDNATGLLTLANGLQTVDPIYLRSNTVAGADAVQRWETSGVARWTLGKGADPETGSNAGGSFVLTSYDDAGALLDTPISVSRAGRTTLKSLNLAGRLHSYDGGNPANGELLIGAGSNGFAKALITPGTGIAIVNGAGTITISATAAGGYETRSANYTLAPSDNGKTLKFDNTTPVTLTIPDDANIPVGSVVKILVDRVVYVQNSSATGIRNRSSLPTHTLLPGIEYSLRREATGASPENWSISVVNGIPGDCRYFDEEFLSATLPGWLTSSNGGTGNNYLSITSGDTINAGRPGAVQAQTGTTATGHRSIGTNSASIALVTGRVCFVSSVVQVPIAPTGTEDFRAMVGLQSSLNSATALGAFFRCQSAQNSGQWQAVARTNSAESTLNSAVAVTGLNTLDVLLIPNIAARYWINGIYVGEITTNLPPVTSLVGVVCGIYKTVGTTSRNLNINRLSLLTTGGS